MNKLWVKLITVSIAIVVVFLAVNYVIYRGEIAASRQQLLAGSELIATNSGPIEYASSGDGYPVLVVHGSGGGYDQGMLMAQGFLDSDSRIIAMSRFGYLRTPLPADASPAAQADAFAALLDELNIKRAAIIAMSNGGPSALQFAIRYPDRLSALIMVDAISHRAPPPSWIAEQAFGIIFKSDFGYWLIARYFETQVMSLLGVPPEVQASLTPAEKERFLKVLQIMHPISLRVTGMINDGSYTTSPDLDSYPLERITAPTLVIHAIDDSLIPFSHGQNTAQKVPGALLATLESGGHLAAGQLDRVKSEVTGFLKQHPAEQ